MTYRIQATHTYYAPEPDFVHLVEDFDVQTDTVGPVEFATREEAEAEIGRLDDLPYDLCHNESGRPEYQVVGA